MHYSPKKYVKPACSNFHRLFCESASSCGKAVRDRIHSQSCFRNGMEITVVPENAEISQAARALEAGQLVVFPTETVYGLGADAQNPDAVALVYAIKGRPVSHPLIVHLAKEADLSYWAQSVPREARSLMDAFWPGPLTLILKRASNIHPAVSGGLDTIGLRCPSHPVAMALLNAFREGKGGIAAPSANLFGRISPTRAQHVLDDFGSDSRIAAILDGGQSEVGIESTILDLSRIGTHGPVLLRPGKISASDIAEVAGKKPVSADENAPRVSGTLPSHYAPQSPVSLVTARRIPFVLSALKQKDRRVALIHHSSLPELSDDDFSVRMIMPISVEAYSHRLYASLRTLDEAQADVIIIEMPPQDSAWDGVNDRLRRAAHRTVGLVEKWVE